MHVRGKFVACRQSFFTPRPVLADGFSRSGVDLVQLCVVVSSISYLGGWNLVLCGGVSMIRYVRNNDVYLIQSSTGTDNRDVNPASKPAE
jgi:hypothetical protein